MNMNNIILNAGIRITRKCNMKCSYCNIQSIVKEDLSLEKWMEAAKIIKDIGVTDVVILGGEPTNYSDLAKIVNYFEKEMDLRCSMTTNAFDNYQIVCDVIDAGLSKLGVSIDNLDLKKSISPLKSKLGMDLINNLKKDNYKINLVDYAVLSKKNVNDICDLIKYMTEKNVGVYILPFHHSNEGTYEHRKNNQRSAFITDEDIEMYSKCIDDIIKLKKEGYLVVNSEEFLLTSKKYIKDLNWKCDGLSELRMDSDGSLVCCCDFVGEVNKKYTIFDLKDKDKFNQFIKDRNKDASKCRGCLWPSSVEAEIRKIKVQ